MDELGLKVNKRWLGFLSGIIGPWIGFVIFYLILGGDWKFIEFFWFVIRTTDTSSAIISVSAILNLAVFFWTLNRNYLKATQGVIFATLVYATLVVYFKYVA